MSDRLVNSTGGKERRRKTWASSDANSPAAIYSLSIEDAHLRLWHGSPGSYTAFRCSTRLAHLLLFCCFLSLPAVADIIVSVVSSVHTKSYGQRTLSHSAPTLRNNLSKAIRNSQSALSFKSALKSYLFQFYN